MSANDDAASAKKIIPDKPVGRVIQRTVSKPITAATKKKRTAIEPADDSDSESLPTTVKRKRAKKSAVAAQDLPPFYQGYVEMGEFNMAQVNLLSDNFVDQATQQEMQEDVDAAIEQFNAALEQEERVNSYDHVVPPPPLAIDWRRDDIVIADSWFVPHQLDLVVDNQAAVAQLDQWVSFWNRKPLVLPRCCAALVRGPPGVGKTTSVRLALQKHGFNNIIEINASEERSKKLVQRLFSLMRQFGVVDPARKTAIVLEEIDGLSESSRAEKTQKKATAASASQNRKKKEKGQKGQGTVLGAADSIATSSNSGAEALIAFLNSSGLMPVMPAESFDAQASCDPKTAPAVGNELWSPFRSPLPIIMLANENNTGTLFKRLSALQIRFAPIKDEFMIYRLVNDLSQRLGLIWTKPSSANYFKDVPLYRVLATHASGDMRKATMLMAEAVRAAYARRKHDARDKLQPTLTIRTVDCSAFFGRSREDVLDAPPSLFGAARFVLCQAECVCTMPCTCKKKTRATVSSIALKQGDFFLGSQSQIDELTVGKTGQKATVWQQMQRTAANNLIPALPEMLFENYLQCTAEPISASDVDSRLAASTVRQCVAYWHSMAESVRSDYCFLTNEIMRDLHAQMGTVATALVIRYPEKYVPDIPADSVERPKALSKFGALNLQRPAIDGENGNACGTMSKARKERNAYVEFFNLPYQQSLDAWYDWDNYVSNIGQTRAQKNMLSCTVANKSTTGRKKAASKKKTESSVDDDESNGGGTGAGRMAKTKMSEEERNKLKFNMKQAQEIDAMRSKAKASAVTMGMSNLTEQDAAQFFLDDSMT